MLLFLFGVLRWLPVKPAKMVARARKFRTRSGIRRSRVRVARRRDFNPV